MRSFIYIFFILNSFFLIIQFFIVHKISKKYYRELHDKFFYEFSSKSFLHKPFRFKVYHRYYNISYENNIFFFCNSNLDAFIFHVDSAFSFKNFVINNYSFPTYISPFRWSYFNYSLTYVNICRVYKFSESDFLNLEFSKDFSYVFGSFSVLHSAHVGDSPFTNIYNYRFVFSLVDFSIALYIVFPEYNKDNILIPVAYYKLSRADYNTFINKFDIKDLEKNIFDKKYLISVFSKFFYTVFSGLIIPSRDSVSYGYKRYPYLFYRAFVYSNIDSRYFTVQDTPLEYYTYISTPRTNFDTVLSPNKIFTIRAFSFFRLKLLTT